MIIRLPVKPFIKKYLNRQFGKELKLSDFNYFSALIKAHLRKFEKGNPIVQRNNNKIIDGVNFVGFDIFIGDATFIERGAFINTKDILFLNEAMDNMISRQMYDWIYSPNSPFKEVDYNIIAFRDMYDISEDELPFDNLKRWFYRERKRMQQRADYLIPEKEYQLIINFKYEVVKEVVLDNQLSCML